MAGLMTGVAWSPRLSALREPKQLFPEVSIHTKAGRSQIWNLAGIPTSLPYSCFMVGHR